MHETLGTRLRSQRERKQISLASIAEQTKIHLPLLEELERDEVRHWPSGIFRRAFIRAYAEAISLQPDDVVREFMTLYPDPIEVVSIGTAMASVASTKERPPTRFGQIAGAATESLLAFMRKLVGYDTNDELLPPGTSSAPIGSPRPFSVAATFGNAPPPPALATPAVDFFAAASVCTKLAQADTGADLTLLLHEAARILDAVGVIVWAWDPAIKALTPAMADGYSERVLAQLPKVGRDANNATAAAFRSSQTCAVAGGESATSALAVPVPAPDGCVGVLAVELPNGAEKAPAVRAVLTMIAAQLGRLVEPRPEEADRYERSALRRA